MVRDYSVSKSFGVFLPRDDSKGPVREFWVVVRKEIVPVWTRLIIADTIGILLIERSVVIVFPSLWVPDVLMSGTIKRPFLRGFFRSLFFRQLMV